MKSGVSVGDWRKRRESVGGIVCLPSRLISTGCQTVAEWDGAGRRRELGGWDWEPESLGLRSMMHSRTARVEKDRRERRSGLHD